MKCALCTCFQIFLLSFCLSLSKLVGCTCCIQMFNFLTNSRKIPEMVSLPVATEPLLCGVSKSFTNVYTLATLVRIFYGNNLISYSDQRLRAVSSSSVSHQLAHMIHEIGSKL